MPGLPGCSAPRAPTRPGWHAQNSDTAFFASHPKYKFVMVNHVTTNSFFTATIYGLQDACAITGCSYQWTGSTTAIVSEMVSAMDAAIAGKANGIGVCLVDNTAFNKPVDNALGGGIPVIAYNADVAAGVPNNRMAYVGQNNLTAGAAVGNQILRLGIKKGDKVAGVIATPGTGNIQPRIDGAKPVLVKAGDQLRRGRDVRDPGIAGVQQDRFLVRRQQGREVHVRRGQR